jgi:Uma2 family endonuclease
MAIEILSPRSQLLTVTTVVPNERETQILGGNQAHSIAGFDLAQTLRTYAGRRGLVWMVRSETELRYPRADGTTGSFYPDVLLAANVDLDDREPYDLRTVGKPPSLVVEIISPKTAGKDVGPKRAAYAEMGVAEYVTFDPRPRKKLALHGYRLGDRGRYVEITPAAEGGLWLTTIDLRVKAEPATQPFRGPLLRLTTPAVEPLLHVDEETAARDAAETEIARLRLLLERAERDRRV